MFDSISLQSAKCEFFLPPYQLNLFLASGEAKRFFRHHILINTLSMNYYMFLNLMKSLNKIPYRKLSLNFKEHSKIRKKHVLTKYFFPIRFCHIFYFARIWLNLTTSKAFRSSRSKMFYETDVLEKFAKFTENPLHNKNSL